MSKLIKKIAQRVAVDYCRLSIVECSDGFLTQDAVRSLLGRECGLEVVAGSNLQLRVHYELHYKNSDGKRFVYVCNSLDAILPDMKNDTFQCNFSVSDVFPLFTDKTLIRRQSFEVLDTLYEKVAMRRVGVQEGELLVASVIKEIEDRKARTSEFFKEQLQAIDIDWTHPSPTIASVSKIVAKAVKEGAYDGIDPMIAEINDSFQRWVDAEYFATLQSNPLLRAKSVDKILPHIASNYEKENKVALLVVDGVAYWQYIVLRDFLRESKFIIEDGCTLAWMPSITMLSRQAIFRGEVPLQDYRQSPENEKRLWMEFWQKQGFCAHEIQYIYDTDEFAVNEGVKRLAMVTVEMDEKMHSSTDYKDLYSLTENWCSRIIEQMSAIVNAGYMLYLTTDHGSVLSHGWRNLTQIEKVFLYKDGSRGMRHLIYNNKEEQERFYAENRDLPMVKHDNWLALRDNSCFAKENKTQITHGGSHFMEMIVPLIKIEKQWL